MQLSELTYVLPLLLDIMDSSFTDLYANDTQLYFAFRPITTEQQSSLARIEACVSHVDSWLVRNKLKLNRGKTELLVLNANHRHIQPYQIQDTSVNL